MAAIALAAATSNPLQYTQASIGTTWQEFTLPTWLGKCTVTFEGTPGYVGFVQTGIGSPETPADGGAVGTHRQPIAADSPAEIAIPRVAMVLDGSTAVSSIFLAAQSGTVTATILFEKVPSEQKP